MTVRTTSRWGSKAVNHLRADFNPDLWVRKEELKRLPREHFRMRDTASRADR